MNQQSEGRTVRLTEPQRSQLQELASLKMPASYIRDGWPGFPARSLDGRLTGPLQKRGYIECGIHQTPCGSKGVWWRITDAGRAALSNIGETA